MQATQNPVTPLHGIEHLFEKQAQRSPTAIALACGDQRVTYEELSRRSNQVAHYLRRKGVRAESLVGVYMQRGTDMVAAMFGILKSGGAYVPLDPRYPSQRVEYIMKDSGLKAVLTQERQVPSLPALEGLEVVCLDRELDRITKELPDCPAVSVTGDGLAYVIYTSGSTGRPKGVGIRRHSTAVFFHWAHGVFGDDLMGTLACTSICFDLSIFEILVPLGMGGTVFIVDSLLDLHSISPGEDLRLVNTVPSALSEVLRQHRLPATVRTVNLAGEAVHRSLVNRIYRQSNVQRVFNLYGPTEDTTYSTWSCLSRSEDGAVPIGAPVTDTEVLVLDEDDREVGSGAPGELYLAGEGLARGYIHQPALTAERFVPNPFSNERGARMYRTGDRVRALPDGNLEFLGRTDDQVKIRGFRIELREIETVLKQHPDIPDAAVAVQQDASGLQRLVAYVAGTEPPTVPSLRNYLARQLPDYMLPAQFVFLRDLPRTSTGKLSRHELPAPEIAAPDLVPQTATERALADVCSEVLGIAAVPLNSSFIELGGSSLNATRVIAALRTAFSCDLPIRELLDSKTLREVAAECARLRTLPSSPPVIFAKTLRGADPCPASFSQERVWFVQQVDPSNLAYCFTAQITFFGALQAAALEKALNRIVQRHEIFRTTLSEMDGRLFQVIHEPWEVRLDCIDLRGRHAEAQRILEEIPRRPFDVSALPLVRWNMVRLEDAKYLFQSVEHHMVHDGWSYYVFLKELMELYLAFTQGAVPRIHPSPLQFADFSQWQRQWINTPAARQQMRYWSETLAHVPPLLSLPYDRPRREIQTHRGESLRIELAEDLYDVLVAVARRSRSTPFMLCIAAFQILLFRYTGQDDFCIGTGIANRRWPETSDLIGMVVNSIALRLRISTHSTVAEVIENVRETALSAYANQDLPFDQVVHVVQPERDLSYNPIFQVMLSFHDSPMTVPALSNIAMTMEQALNNGSAKFDINIVVIPPQSHSLPLGYRSRAMMLWEYNTDLFDASTIQRMVRHYLRLLDTLLKTPETRMGDISLLTDAELHDVMLDWNSPNHSPSQTVKPGFIDHGSTALSTDKP